MYDDMKPIRCAIVRGGTSKGIFIKRNELPGDEKMRDNVIRAIFGSPDVRQIDGLGGADILTSKLAIIAPASRPDADVDYTFAQVSFDSDMIDYKGNCGNISSAVGSFAIDEGMVAPVEPVTTVRVHQTNSNSILIAQVPVKNGKALASGDFEIDGVPGTGAKITMDWADTVGAMTGKLLPTGNVKDIFTVDGREYPVSLVDAGNPLVFISAGSLGMKGTESPAQIEGNDQLMALIEKLRSQAAVIFGLVSRPEDAAKLSPYNPFFAIISKPADFTTLNGKAMKAADMDVTSRLLFMLRMHKAYPISGTVCTGAAARIPGSVVWDVLSPKARGNGTLRIGHPSGVVLVEAYAHNENGAPRFDKLGIYRTARRIMDGIVYVKNAVFEKGE